MAPVPRGGPVTGLRSLGAHLDRGVEMLGPELDLGNLVRRIAMTAQLFEDLEAEREPLP